MVLALARRHRVEGLMHRAFADAAVALPEKLGLSLARAADASVSESLLQAAESARLQRLLAEQGVQAIFLKGVSLAVLAYGTLGLKRAWDIDLLVNAEDASLAINTLVGEGYRRSYPGSEITDAQLLEWLTVSKEILWKHPLTGLVVELHTGLVDNSFLLREVQEKPNLQTVALGSGITLTTLQTDELFAYLCVHGSGHGWARLKWLADVAALLAPLSSTEMTRLYQRAASLGARRSAAQAILLCVRLLNLSAPILLMEELRRDGLNLWLERLALSSMSSHQATELDDTLFGTVVINLSHVLLGEGWRYRYEEVARKLRNPQDQFGMPLPPSLRFLYPALAIPRWIARRAKLKSFKQDRHQNRQIH
jgi:hypothetical protein